MRPKLSLDITAIEQHSSASAPPQRSAPSHTLTSTPAASYIPALSDSKSVTKLRKEVEKVRKIEESTINIDNNDNNEDGGVANDAEIAEQLEYSMNLRNESFSGSVNENSTDSHVPDSLTTPPNNNNGHNQKQKLDVGFHDTREENANAIFSFDETLLFDNSLRDRILKIGGKVGKGATSSVFRGIDALTYTVVALKEIHVGVGEEKKREMLIGELEVLNDQRVFLGADDNDGRGNDNDNVTAIGKSENIKGKEGSDNIVKFYGAFYDTSTQNATLVMEYMEGTMETFSSFARKLPADQFERWLKKLGFDIFKGLTFFHALNRIHRDVKPANILMNSNGDAKLSDFGLSQSMEVHNNKVVGVS